MVGSAALAAEVRKHSSNDAKYSELGWSCVPIAVETDGYWRAETDGYWRAETDGYWRAETDGYWRAETDGYWRAETDGYWRAETDGYWRAEADGYWRAETDGYWRAEAMQTLSRLTTHLATRGNSQAICQLYGRLSLTLMQANSQALLSQSGSIVGDP